MRNPGYVLCPTAEAALTEIPEHLLQRSRERRAALGLGGGETPATAPAESAAPAETAPAAAAAPAPAPTPAAPVEEAKVAPPRPDPIYVQAAKRRKRIPVWAMPVLAALPLWGYVYVRTLEAPPSGESDPLVLGTELFLANCASCHGASGDGAGGAPAFVDGAVVQTWPDWRDHVMWVKLGDANWPGSTYGAQNKPKTTGMPSFGGQLSDQEIAQIVLHERELAGDDVSEGNADYTDLRAVATGEMTLAEAGLGDVSLAAGISESELGG